MRRDSCHRVVTFYVVDVTLSSTTSSNWISRSSLPSEREVGQLHHVYRSRVHLSRMAQRWDVGRIYAKLIAAPYACRILFMEAFSSDVSIPAGSVVTRPCAMRLCAICPSWEYDCSRRCEVVSDVTTA